MFDLFAFGGRRTLFPAGSLMAGLVSAHVNPVCQSYNICRSPLVRSTFLQIPEMAIKHPVAVMKHLKPLSVVASSLQPPKSISTAQFSNTIPSEEVLNFWRSVDAVCFDVDSTVCLDEGIDELADFCGAGKAVAEWTTKAMSGSVPFEEALAARLSLFNPSLSQVKDFLEKRPPRISPGIAELTQKLMAQNIDVYLISGGFRQMINPVALQLGIPLENIFANQLLFGSSGEFVGFDAKEPTSRSGGKATAVQQIRKVHDYKALVMIGDGATDLEAKKPGGADLFICFAGVQMREAVAAKADWLVFNFEELLTSMS
ncbi:phosphoserine phosphatase, chloroplastic-like isoform X1 [Musa acuminata AAA Group]|uniref:phosphoserine phosphatase, chloroplastic-like isoform X1 n=2 Tax=Musa acuminata AAA Group TaxID=214697 RepID=UPI0031D30C0E